MEKEIKEQKAKCVDCPIPAIVQEHERRLKEHDEKSRRHREDIIDLKEGFWGGKNVIGLRNEFANFKDKFLIEVTAINKSISKIDKAVLAIAIAIVVSILKSLFF